MGVDEQDDDGEVRWEVVGLAGAAATAMVRLPRHVTWFWHGPWRFYADITGDLSWWVDLRTEAYPWALAREAYRTRTEALERAQVLAGLFERGQLRRSYPAMFRHRPKRGARGVRS